VSRLLHHPLVLGILLLLDSRMVRLVDVFCLNRRSYFFWSSVLALGLCVAVDGGLTNSGGQLWIVLGSSWATRLLLTSFLSRWSLFNDHVDTVLGQSLIFLITTNLILVCVFLSRPTFWFGLDHFLYFHFLNSSSFDKLLTSDGFNFFSAAKPSLIKPQLLQLLLAF